MLPKLKASFKGDTSTDWIHTIIFFPCGFSQTYHSIIKQIGLRGAVYIDKILKN